MHLLVNAPLSALLSVFSIIFLGLLYYYYYYLLWSLSLLEFSKFGANLME